MPPKSKKVILLINVGVTDPNAESNPSLVEKMKHIAKRKIEKMIFLEPKDEVAIMLMGSADTENSLNTEHVREFIDFQVPNWDLIREVMALQATKYCSNWVEALVAAIEYMKQNAYAGGSATKTIILMSDFNEETDIISQFNADEIANKLSKGGIKLITIGEATLDESFATSLKVSEELLKNVHNKINGQHITFDDAISSLKFYISSPVKPSPTYFNLELLDKKIPIACYVKISKEKFPSWQKFKGDKKVQSKTIYKDKEMVSYTKEEIIKAYKYGESFIPIEKDLEEDMSYKSGEKSYRIYGFTDKNNISKHLEYLYKDTARILLPSSGANDVTKPFYSLVQAMDETNSVAIVRKVSRNNAAPRMVALFPCIDIPDEPWCLVEIYLAFAEDRRIMETRPLKSIVKQLSSEQNEAIDNLIDSLMLNDTEDSYEIDGSQSFLPGFVPSPMIQHRWHVLAHRAINPDKPLPPVENYLKEVLECPSVKERSKSHLQKVAELFQLKDIDPKMKKDEIKEEDKMQIDDSIDIKKLDKKEDNVDAEDDSHKEESSALSIDIEIDEMVANL